MLWGAVFFVWALFFVALASAIAATVYLSRRALGQPLLAMQTTFAIIVGSVLAAFAQHSGNALAMLRSPDTSILMARFGDWDGLFLATYQANGLVSVLVLTMVFWVALRAQSRKRLSVSQCALLASTATVVRSAILQSYDMLVRIDQANWLG